MNVLAIDPGTDHSGVILLDVDEWKVIASWSEMSNSELLRVLKSGHFEWGENDEKDDYWVDIDDVFIETIEARGQIVGNSTIRTCIWVGVFKEAWDNASEGVERYSGVTQSRTTLISRGDEKTVLCGGSTVENPVTGRRQGVTDANVRAAVIARFPATGGGKTPQVGVKKKPGPLFGVKGHAWSALAVAITGLEIRKADEK